ncbi:MAG: A/G-specific adenine glycosylase [Candidatus Eremiobacteraeota bacterium]|nr:A/G-specific adenine glycosylase [Candidatus Eremiobacteraeota bacterium]
MALPMSQSAGVTLIQRRLLRWYQRNGRATLPWRAERSPYRTVVSEAMLAQTQVERVIPKFESFVQRFGDFEALARASPGDVLRAWQGLGYNARALRLRQLAKAVVENHGGVLPSDGEALLALPGIGPYSAAAIRAFGFDLDDAPVDTNVARVVSRLILGSEHRSGSPSTTVQRHARQLVPRGRAHDWNSGLMDLGATVCTARAPKCLICPLNAHCVAAPVAAAREPRERQGVPFTQTARYARGRIVDRLRALPAGSRISLLDLHGDLKPVLRRSLAEVRAFVDDLERDGLLTCNGETVALPE